MLAGDIGQRLAQPGLDIHAQALLGDAVHRTHHTARVQAHDAGGQVGQHRLQVGTLSLDLLAAAARLVARLGQAARHVVEGPHQEAEFVVAGNGQAPAVIALGNRARGLRHVADRRHQPACRLERRPDGGQQAQHQDDGERQGVAELQRLAQVGEFLVVREGRLHAFGEHAEAFRDTEQRLQRIDLAVLSGRLHRHQGARIQPGIADRVETDVIAAVAHGLQHFAARLVRHDIGYLGGTRGDDAAVAAEQREFRRTAAHPDIVDVERQRRRRRIGYLFSHSLCQAKHIAQAHIQCRAAQIQGILQRLLDAHVEPAVDTALQELQREVVDDRNRHDRHQHEHDHQARCQLGAGGLLALLAEQPDDIGHHQRAQHHQPGGVGQQHPGIHLAEAFGVVGGIAHQRQRHQQQREQHQHRQHANAETVHCDSPHWCHSLSMSHAEET